MSIDNAIPGSWETLNQHSFTAVTDADFAKLRVTRALVDFAIDRGCPFNWLRDAMTAAGVLPAEPQAQASALNKHAVAVEVMELLGRFIQERTPDLMPDFVRALERFTPYLAAELS